MNVGSRVASALQSAGHDVERAALTAATAEDPDLLAHAVQTDRILITHDRDFSELVFAGAANPPRGIVYLRYQARDVVTVVAQLMPLLDSDMLDGHMTVIDDRRVRQTPLPPGASNG